MPSPPIRASSFKDIAAPPGWIAHPADAWAGGMNGFRPEAGVSERRSAEISSPRASRMVMPYRRSGRKAESCRRRAPTLDQQSLHPAGGQCRWW